MKLRQLQCLCAVVDAGFNVSRAAAALHTTQSTVSKQLQQLEGELGADLLTRLGGRLVGLTPFGAQTLTWARGALRCTDNIRSAARAGREDAGMIALATGHTHANHVLLPAIMAFQRRYPASNFNVMQGSPSQVADLVRDGAAAIGVTHVPEETEAELVVARFLTSPRLLVVPAGHALLKVGRLTLEEIAAHPMILPASSRPQGARIARTFQQSGVVVKVVVWALDADVIKTYVAARLGVGLIPAFTYDAQKDRGLRTRDVSDLFGPSQSAVLLRRHSYLPKYIYRFIAGLDAALDVENLEAMVMD